MRRWDLPLAAGQTAASREKLPNRLRMCGARDRRPNDSRLICGSEQEEALIDADEPERFEPGLCRAIVIGPFQLSGAIQKDNLLRRLTDQVERGPSSGGGDSAWHRFDRQPLRQRCCVMSVDEVLHFFGRSA